MFRPHVYNDANGLAMGVVTESSEFCLYMIISFPSGLNEAAYVAIFWLYTYSYSLAWAATLFRAGALSFAE